MDIYTNKNTAVTIFTEYGSRFGWTGNSFFLMEVVADLKFIYLLSDSVGIVIIVQSQWMLDNSGQCTGVKFIFGKKLIDLFQDLLSL